MVGIATGAVGICEAGTQQLELEKLTVSLPTPDSLPLTGILVGCEAFDQAKMELRLNQGP